MLHNFIINERIAANGHDDCHELLPGNGAAPGAGGNNVDKEGDMLPFVASM